VAERVAVAGHQAKDIDVCRGLELREVDGGGAHLLRRPAEQISLARGNAEAPDDCKLRGRLHALGDDRGAPLGGELLEGAKDAV
jgi:hypothetical protein